MVPVQLIAEAAIAKGFLKLLDVLLGELVALGQVRVEIAFGTAALEPLEPRLPLQLPAQ